MIKENKHSSTIPLKGIRKNRQKKMQEVMKSFEQLQDLLNQFPPKVKKPAPSTIGKWESEQIVNIT